MGSKYVFFSSYCVIVSVVAEVTAWSQCIAFACAHDLDLLLAVGYTSWFLPEVDPELVGLLLAEGVSITHCWMAAVERVVRDYARHRSGVVTQLV